MTEENDIRRIEAPNFGRSLESMTDIELHEEHRWHEMNAADTRRANEIKDEILSRIPLDLDGPHSDFPKDRFVRGISQAFGALGETARLAAYPDDEDTAEDKLKEHAEMGQLPDHFEHAPNLSAALYYFQCGDSALYVALERYIQNGPAGVADYVEEAVNESNPMVFQDGSKGQWRVCHNSKIRTLNWLLGEEYVESFKETDDE